ncbi:putative armadillo-like helical, importin beta family [Helianthus annuus]|nr:putative armadillo-like helical, importin beta family [Helianthus annuus]KAJ0759713.1 putative armadillo-like helical, importin beta family [Helianthus annuus]KAJ0816694.1 putative armadillo-like helical, importin beta family [Helianthus annuus]
MALAIGVHFEDYVCYVLPLMKEAADGCAESDGEYANGLKRSIFKAYSGILQGCNGSNAELMKPHVSHLLNFMQKSFKKPNRYVCVMIVFYLNTVVVLIDLLAGPAQVQVF